MYRVGKSFPPHRQVLKDISLSFFLGAKIGIIGLNGSGKSTLLKIIAGMEKEYQGEITFLPGYSVGHLSQDPLLDESRTVREIVEEGLKETMELLKEFEKINNSLWTGRLFFRKRSTMLMAGISNTGLSVPWMR
jgi:ATPase subunit of ABC transporter with duplicated ATPase domains